MSKYQTILKARHIRATPQRLVILNILAESGNHLTPVDIFDQARQTLPGINEATVYRTLDFLTRQGLILCAHMGSGRIEYEVAEMHHHLVCPHCQHSVQIPHTLLEPLFAYIQEQYHFHMEPSHMAFFGICPDCQGIDSPSAPDKPVD